MQNEIPVKDIIVNEDSQVVLLNASGTAYSNSDASPSTGGIILEGFLSPGTVLGSEFDILYASMRILKQTTVAAVAQVATLVLSSTLVLADATFRLVYQSLDLTPTEFQNVPVEKRYQIPVQSTTAGIGAAIIAAINADKYAPVTVTGSTTLTFTAKKTGVNFWFYSDTIAGTWAVGTAASSGNGIYDTLKNINWSQNFDIDRNLEWLPRKGASYTQYYFRITKNNAAGGSNAFPSLAKQAIKTDYRLYVRNGLTLETAMNLLTTNMNV